jgi:GT2 family glycosyltransferase
MIRGHIDKVSPFAIEGWLVDDDAVGPIRVEAFVGERSLGSAQADIARGDLRHNGLGDCGFYIALASPLLLGEQLASLRLLANGEPWSQDVKAGRPGVSLPFRIRRIYGSAGDVVVDVVRGDRDWTGDWPGLSVQVTPETATVELRQSIDNDVHSHRVRLLSSGEPTCSVHLLADGVPVAGPLTVAANPDGPDFGTPPPGQVTVGERFITGWMRDAGGSDGRAYTVRIDGARVGSGLANRPETAAGPGRSGLLFPITRAFRDGREHAVEVVRAADGAVLPSRGSGLKAGGLRLDAAWREGGLLVELDTAQLPSPPAGPLDFVLYAGGQPIASRQSLEFGEPDRPRAVMFEDDALADQEGRTLQAACPAVGALSPLIEWPSESLVGELRGNLDVFDGRVAMGWCFYALQPQATVLLDVFVDDLRVGEVTASTNRPDLASLGLRYTGHGFTFALPARVLDGESHTLVLRDRKSRAALPGTPRTVLLRRDVLRSRPRPPLPPLNAVTTSPAVNAGRTGAPAGPPLATIVILTRDGAEVLARCLESLWWFAPRDLFKVVVVDHGSRDDTQAVVATWSDRLAIGRLGVAGNNGYSFGNNAAIRAHADTPFVLLLNNDVVLISDVVSAMVAALDARPDVGMVGCRLLEARDLRDLSGATVHHAGILLALDADGVVRPREARGEIPVSEANRPVETFSVTGACAMMRTEDYLAVGGLQEAYFYDSEDVELGEQIRVKLGKTVLCLNDLTALHHRGWYRMSARANAVNARMQANDGVLLRRLGHQMKKRRQRSLYSNTVNWSLDKGVVGFVVLDSPVDETPTPVSALAGALQANAQVQTVYVDPDSGWYDAEGLTCLVNTRPEYNVEELVNAAPDLLRVAWIQEDFERWRAEQRLETYDLLLCASAGEAEALAALGLRGTVFPFGAYDPVPEPAVADRAAAAFLAALDTRLGVARVAIKTGAPDLTQAGAWGDTYLAEDLARRLRRRGVRVSIETLDRWYAPGDLVDAVIVLRGLSAYQPRPQDLNLLWLISHPDAVAPDELRRYDKVAFASETLRARYGDLDGRSVLARQFSGFGDAPLLSPAQQALLARVSGDDVLVVGNTRGVRREFILEVHRRTPLKFIGAGWDQYVSADCILAEFLENSALPAVYARALAVVNDHWPDMATSGVISNRIADVLASGGLVLSDWVEEGAGLLGEGLFFRTPDTLVAAIDRFRSDPRARTDLIERSAALAAERMSGEAAAEAILAALSQAHERRFEGWFPGA